MIPGKIETWISIMDLDGVGISDFGNISEFKDFDDNFMRNFMGRNHKIIVCNIPGVISGLWKIMYGWLDSFT